MRSRAIPRVLCTGCNSTNLDRIFDPKLIILKRYTSSLAICVLSISPTFSFHFSYQIRISVKLSLLSLSLPLQPVSLSPLPLSQHLHASLNLVVTAASILNLDPSANSKNELTIRSQIPTPRRALFRPRSESNVVVWRESGVEMLMKLSIHGIATSPDLRFRRY